MTHSKTYSSHRRPILDCLRWVSAATVAVGHAVAILNSEQDGSAALQFISNTRDEAVLIFFLISGYLIGGPILRNISVDLRTYTIKRYVRIYIVLIPALALTLILDISALYLWPDNPVLSLPWQGGALGGISVLERMTWVNFLSSLLNLEPLLGRPFGSAGSLWSLGYEWIFYFALPLILKIANILRFSRRGFDALVLASVGGVALISPIGAAFWLVWLMGAYAAVLDTSKWLASPLNRSVVKFLALLSSGVLILLGQFLPHQITILLLGISGATCLNIRHVLEPQSTSHVHGKLADFSYSLYVTHLQVQTF